MENSKIEWCDHTFNPWMGCTRVSPGCQHCYAETLMDSRYGKVKWGPQGKRVRTSEAYWKKPLAWNKQAEREGRRFRVFCASLADVFERKEELDPWRWQLWHLIVQTPHLDWLLLTKRPENVNYMVPWGSEAYPWPENVWIGTSVESQEWADKRIPELLKVPAVVRFLSVEPLLGPVDLFNVSYRGDTDYFINSLTRRYSTSKMMYPDNGVYMSFGMASLGKINWVIVGGESGAEARPMHPNWVRAIRDQCNNAGIPFFFKQWGEWAPNCVCGRKKPCQTIERPVGYFPTGVMFRCGKKKGGRLLDGREWNEFPK